MEIESAPLQKSAAHNEENKSCTNAGMITFILGLVSGTFSALLCKMAYDTKSVGIDGTEKTFAKPIMMLTLMFAGMSPALLFWYIQQRTLPPEKRDVIPFKTIAILVIPSLCDLFCTLLLLVAQLYITASLWQMMRGSIIIITALLKRYALGHRLKMHMWLGVAFITFAMLLVAATSFFGPNADVGSSKDPRIGIVLVLVGCIAQGVQCKSHTTRPSLTHDDTSSFQTLNHRNRERFVPFTDEPALSSSFA
jgi:drug/metabolite transporter (DMT)-like permease